MIVRRVAPLAPAVLPLLGALFVMTVAMNLHRQFATDVSGVCCDAADVDIAPPAGDRIPRSGALRPDIYSQRIRFVAAAQFQAAAILAATAFGLAIIAPLALGRDERGRRAYVLLATITGIAAALTFIGANTSPMLHSLLKATVRHEFVEIETYRVAFERLTSVAATTLVIAVTLLLLPVAGDLERRLRTTARRHLLLSHLLFLGTTLLASDVLLKMAAGDWALSYYGTSDREQVGRLVDAIISGWAVYDSLFLAATYIPAAVVLRGRLSRYATDVQPHTAPAWFDRSWLTESPLQEISRALAILGPFLVGQSPKIADLLK